MAFQSKCSIKLKIVIIKLTEHVQKFNYLGWDMPYKHDEDMQKKLDGLQYMCWTIQWTLINKINKLTQVKLHKVTAEPLLSLGFENCLLNRIDKRKTEETFK
jgi:hypothetical protein